MNEENPELNKIGREYIYKIIVITMGANLSSGPSTFKLIKDQNEGDLSTVKV